MPDSKHPPEALIEVPCRICLLSNITKMFARVRLSGHIGGAHAKAGWTKTSYIAKWDAALDFYTAVNNPEKRQTTRNQMLEINHERKLKRSAGVDEALDTLITENRDSLTDTECAFYDQFFEQIVQQTDRDETQMPQIASLAFDNIMVKRLRTRLLNATKASAKIDALIATGEMEKVLKTTEERIQKTMTALGISRDAQLKRGAIIKSTPAALISGYLDEIERMSPEMLDALQLEEKRVYAVMGPRIDKFILSAAPEIEKEDESDDASGTPLTLDQALEKAGITAGGSIEPTESTGPASDLPF